MKKCAVIIGVDKTGGLPVLNAAGSGAIDMANWANEQQFDVTLLTDANDRPVTVDLIKNAIRGYLDQHIYEQLVVYFSGHGILRGPDFELWLLSGSPNDPNEAVNLSGSILAARNARLRHVVFISDACRSQPTTMRLTQVQGSIIFPNEEPLSPRPTVDVFYATLPGETALEVSPNQAISSYRGIFTEHILKGLKGLVAQVIVEIGSPPQVQRVVPAWELKNYLEREVPLAASTIHLALKQEPEVRVESHHPPSYLSLLPQRSADSTAEWPSDYSVTPPMIVDDRLDDRFSKNVHPSRRGIHKPNKSLDKAGEKFTNSVNRLLQVGRRESSAIQTGFIIVGMDVKNCVASIPVDVSRNEGAVQVRLSYEPQQADTVTSVLIEFSNETGVLLGVLPGFVGTVIVEENQVITVNYTPSKFSSKFIDFENELPIIEKRRAFAAVSAKSSLSWLKRDRADKGAQYLRKRKALDPTLGLYAAYAYIQTGRLEEVQLVLDYMSEELIGLNDHYIRVPILFDVALLAGKLSNDSPLSPLCPVLNQGWAYTEPYRGRLLPVILEASHYLRPGLWTSFEKKGVAILKSGFTNRLIR